MEVSLPGMRQNLKVALICISLIGKAVTCFFEIFISLLSEVASKDFLHPVGCLFALLMISFAVQKLSFLTVPLVNS